MVNVKVVRNAIFSMYNVRQLGFDLNDNEKQEREREKIRFDTDKANLQLRQYAYNTVSFPLILSPLNIHLVY